MALLVWDSKRKYDVGPLTYTGRRGGVRIFSIHYNSISGTKSYRMYVHLPGYKSEAAWDSDNVEELQEGAEGIFARWLKRVSLAPKEVA
jgi:hypothetical protein